jgi:hypothetical protein
VGVREQLAVVYGSLGYPCFWRSTFWLWCIWLCRELVPVYLIHFVFPFVCLWIMKYGRSLLQ